MKLTIYAPTEDARILGITPNSAIVGRPVEGDPTAIEIYYEGNVYGAANLNGFQERLRTAADRLVRRYPTIASAWVPPSAVIAVGEYDTVTRHALITNVSALLAWSPALRPQVVGQPHITVNGVAA